MKKILGSLLAATMLFAAPTAQEVANQLKALQGETLKNPVIFVKYGKDIFDWLAVTTDGKFAAKLNGLNPDGSFNYTILGDPAEYGLKIDVSLNGVKITSTANDESSLPKPVGTITKNVKLKVAKTAISTLFDSSALSGTQLSSGWMREAKTPALLSPQFFKRFNIPQSYTREYYRDSCPAGGTYEAVGSEMDHSFIFHQCKVDSQITLNGKVHMQIISDYKAKGDFQNYSATTPQFSVTIGSATIDVTYNDDEDITAFSLSIPSATVQLFQNNITVYYKNFTQNFNLNGTSYRVSTGFDVKTSCQNEWTKVSTLSPIRGSLYRTCLTGGYVQAKRGSVTTDIQINPDSSIDVIDAATNQKIEHYSNCHAVPNSDICAE